MSREDEMVSAALDGALDRAGRRRLRELEAFDPDYAARRRALSGADVELRATFAEALRDPVPPALVSAVLSLPEPRRRLRRALLGAGAMALAASLGAVAALGVFVTRPGPLADLLPSQAAPAARGWIEEVADYHRLYAAEGRHLVEVGAEEREHIEAWLGDRVGRAFAVPDLGQTGLTFEGARLLLAAGRPVAQLVYTAGEGEGRLVVALCITPRPGVPDARITRRSLGDLAAWTWRDGGTGFLVIGPDGDGTLDLGRIATLAAERV